MSEFIDYANEALEELRKERNKVHQAKILFEEKPPVLVDDNQSNAYNTLLECCPSVKNKPPQNIKNRTDNFVNDLIDEIINQYPENIRVQIREEVLKTMNASP